ncbi:hypothetical protein PMIN04_000937 [Paraphaeosphaeria minitans]
MEKAVGCQLVKKWGEMEDLSYFEFIKNLCEIEADLAAITFPAHGSLYLRPTLPAFGVALAEREIARIEQNPKVIPYGPPRGSIEEQLAALEIAKEVFLKMDAKTLPGRLPWLTVWHTDLHMGNIYVSDEEPTQIVSLIDWQSIMISPLFYQVRFPEFISIGEDYELRSEIPTLPENINEIDNDD